MAGVVQSWNLFQYEALPEKASFGETRPRGIDNLSTSRARKSTAWSGGGRRAIAQTLRPIAALPRGGDKLIHFSHALPRLLVVAATASVIEFAARRRSQPAG
jgi:hypothetical protein